jgi:hypothetical protein
VTPFRAAGSLTDAMLIAQRGYDAWAAKPHNARWVRKLDGTPIPNDLIVNIAEAFAVALAKPSPCEAPQVEREGSREENNS